MGDQFEPKQNQVRAASQITEGNSNSLSQYFEVQYTNISYFILRRKHLLLIST
jgi:hypothetical protein